MILKKQSDPFVKACEDYMCGDNNAQIKINSNKADSEEVSISYFFRSYDEMPDLEKHALLLCDGKVLDIGAGTGSHSLILQDYGLDVTALEINPGLVNVMKQRGVIKTIAENIYKFSGQKFDTLLLLMNGIGLTGDFDGLRDFLTHAKTILNPGGNIILDSSDIMYLYEEEDGSFLIDLSDDYYGVLEYNFEYKEAKSEVFKWLYIDYEQLKFYAEENGFDCELLLEGEHYNYLAKLTLIT